MQYNNYLQIALTVIMECVRCDKLNIRILAKLPVEVVQRINAFVGHSRTLPINTLFGFPMYDDLIVSSHEGVYPKNVFNIHGAIAFATDEKGLLAVSDLHQNITFYRKHPNFQLEQLYNIRCSSTVYTMCFRGNKLYYGMTSRVGVYDFETNEHKLSYIPYYASNETVYGMHVDTDENITFVSGRNLLRCELNISNMVQQLLERDYDNKEIVAFVPINNGYIIGELNGAISFVENNVYNVIVSPNPDRSYTGMKKIDCKYVYTPNMWYVESASTNKHLFVFNNGDIFNVSIDSAMYKGNVGHNVTSVCSNGYIFIAFGERTTEICIECI